MPRIFFNSLLCHVWLIPQGGLPFLKGNEEEWMGRERVCLGEGLTGEKKGETIAMLQYEGRINLINE